ncbi:pentatricopeptide repeat-containing protein, putative [Ricinus communis]|uniref:Pentatricopeptide repeat-containing protein, putative n=1 Tax=Ricinus communis TaxID=3988 RepID=B9S6E6_RICCO|nr:pentatricopeptide repeat-containing protein, putative [Ricinus communis]
MAPFALHSTMTQTLSLLEKCSSMMELKQIHAQMFKTGSVLETITISELQAFAASPNSGNLTYAKIVFDSLSSRPNTYIWNAMLRGYADSNKPEEALILYHQMLCHSVPHNGYTFPFLLKACSSLSAIEKAQQVHAQIIKLGFGSDVYTTNSLLHAYAASGFIESARIIFDRIPHPDTVSWNSIIDGYVKCGETETAYELFKDMPEKNAISFTVMISGHVQAGLDKEALDLFQEMQIAGIKPDKIVLTNVLSACAHLGALDQGRWIHTYIKKNDVQIDPMLGCALTDMYAKCGSMQDALEVFKKTRKKSVSLWTALIHGFAIHGRGREALYCLQLYRAC